MATYIETTHDIEGHTLFLLEEQAVEPARESYLHDRPEIVGHIAIDPEVTPVNLPDNASTKRPSRPQPHHLEYSQFSWLDVQASGVTFGSHVQSLLQKRRYGSLR